MDLGDYVIKTISIEQCVDVLEQLKDPTSVDLGVCNVILGTHPQYGDIVLVNTLGEKHAAVLPFAHEAKIE